LLRIILELKTKTKKNSGNQKKLKKKNLKTSGVKKKKSEKILKKF